MTTINLKNNPGSKRPYYAPTEIYFDEDENHYDKDKTQTESDTESEDGTENQVETQNKPKNKPQKDVNNSEENIHKNVTHRRQNQSSNKQEYTIDKTPPQKTIKTTQLS